MGTLKILTSTEAWRIASSIRNALLDAGLSANVCVVNRDGRPLCEITMDNTRPFTATLAFHKAQQSASVGRRTRWIRDQVADGEIGLDALGIDPAKFVKWAGGVPVYDSQGTLLGGAGVSNLSEDQDEAFCAAGVEACRYASDRDQPSPDGNPEGVIAVHHTAFGLPYREMVERFVEMLQKRGAITVSSDDAKCKYFLRVNPWDEALLEVFLEDNRGTSVHVDHAVADLGVIKQVHAVADDLLDVGLPNMVFLVAGKETADGPVTAELAFSQR